MASDLNRQIVKAVLAGMDLDTIEDTIIDPAPLDDEEKSALWLFAEALEESRGELTPAEHELVLPSS